MQTWRYFIRGGAFGGLTFTASLEPTPMLWIFTVPGSEVPHASWQLSALEDEELENAVAYRLEERIEMHHHAVYVLGDSDPNPEREISRMRGLPRPQVLASGFSLETLRRDMEQLESLED